MTSPATRRATWLKALVLVVATGLALRLPYLSLLPHLTDESVEVRWAYDIAFHGARPLTHADAYYGPLWPYLLATVMRVLGASLDLPRLFSLTFGIASLGLTFALGARLARRGRELETATLAALLLAVNFTHAFVLSRVAWENSSSPFWGTAAAISLLAARRQPDRLGRWVVAGILAGLALHTHPSLILLLASCGLWFIVPHPRTWLTRRGPWLAAGLAILAYSPVLVYNLQSRFESLAEAGASTNVSTGSDLLVGWPGRIAGMAVQLGRTLWGGWRLVVQEGAASNVDPVPLVSGLFGVAALVAVIGMAGRGGGVQGSPGLQPSLDARRLPLAVVAVGVVGLPLVNRNWSGLLEARYLGYLLPFICVALADALIGVGLPWLEADGGRRFRRRHILSVTCLLFLIVAPIWSLRTYQGQATAAGLDNRRLVRMADLAFTAQTSDPALRILVDRDLKSVAWAAGGHPRRAVEHVLTLRGVPFEVAAADKINYFLAAHTPSLMFLAGSTAEDLGARYKLESVDARKRVWEGAWGLFRSSGLASKD